MEETKYSIRNSWNIDESIIWRFINCPACGNGNYGLGICKVCGYEPSLDYARFLTLGFLSGDERKTKKTPKLLYKDAEYEQMKLEYSSLKAENVKLSQRLDEMEAGYEQLKKMIDDMSVHTKNVEEKSYDFFEEEVIEEDFEETEPQFKEVAIGSTVKFGNYWQEDENQKIPVEWLVLDKKDGKVLILSKYILDCQPYNKKYKNVTWETCTIRSWLNDEFLNNAFSSEEQRRIAKTKGLNGYNPDYKTDKGNDIEDRMFLLSIDEVKQYFNSKEARKCAATQYAKDQGVGVSYRGTSYWWLRSAGSSGGLAAIVDNYGDVDSYGGPVNYFDNGVRPALWLDPES